MLQLTTAKWVFANAVIAVIVVASCVDSGQSGGCEGGCHGERRQHDSSNQSKLDNAYVINYVFIYIGKNVRPIVATDSNFRSNIQRSRAATLEVGRSERAAAEPAGRYVESSAPDAVSDGIKTDRVDVPVSVQDETTGYLNDDGGDAE